MMAVVVVAVVVVVFVIDVVVPFSAMLVLPRSTAI